MDITQVIQPMYNAIYVVIGASVIAAIFAFSCKPALNAYFNQRDARKWFKFIFGMSELALIYLFAQIFLRP